MIYNVFMYIHSNVIRAMMFFRDLPPWFRLGWKIMFAPVVRGWSSFRHCVEDMYRWFAGLVSSQLFTF